MVDVVAEPLVKSLLDLAKQGDRRIKLVRESSADGVAAATNEGLDLPTGEFVAFPTRDHAELLTQCVEGVLHRTDYSNI